MEVSVFGKLPSQADFFRHGYPGPSAREGEKWFLEAYQMLRGLDLELPRTAVSFIFAHPEWPEVLISTAVASRDSVERPFPIMVFGALDASLVAGRGWMLPVIFARFLDAAQAALYRAAASGDGKRLVAELERLPVPDPAVFQRLGDAIYSNVVHTQQVQAFETRVFGSRDARYYAYRTLRMACDQTRADVPGQASTVLECPVIVDIDLVAWSALVARVLGRSLTAPMIWRMEPDPRLLLSLGPLPLQALHFLVDAGADSMRYWPLTTNSASAMASARDTLAACTTWDRAGETLHSLFERIAALNV
jgi:type VI secretion system ImpM family protein